MKFSPSNIVRNLQDRVVCASTSRIARIAANPEYSTAIKIGVAAGALVGTPLAHASQQRGLAGTFDNFTGLGRLVIDFIVVIGMVVGLGYVLGGLFSAYKKYDRGNEDITWGKIATQVGVGGGAMALSLLAKLVIETVGGSEDDMGRKVEPGF